MIRLIAAIDRKRGIGKKGYIPWYIPDDEAYFTQQTQLFGGHVLTGATTFKITYHGPLANRHNFILTHDQTPLEGVELVHDLESFLQQYANSNLWVAGGADVFTQVISLGQADELYLTKIEADFGCDRFFPEYEANFNLIEQSDLHEQNGFLYTYTKYQRNSG